MQYSKQEVNKSKLAYNSANRLSWWIKDKKSGVDSAEGLIWVLCAVLAVFALILTGYGTAGNSAAFLESLILSLIPLSPAIVFSLIRRLVRVIMKQIIALKYKQGQLYVNYEREMTNIRKDFLKSVDKIVAMIKLKDINLSNAVHQLEQDIGKIESGYKMSPHQEEELEKDFEAYVLNKTTDLSLDQKNKLAKIFNDVGKER